MNRPKPTLASTMTPFPHSVEEGTSVDEAQSLMLEHGIHHLPVVMGAQLVGILSDGDLLLAGYLVGSGRRVDVGTVCTRQPYAVDVHADLAEVAATMAEKHYGCAIVLKEEKVVGILTTTDLARLVATLLGKEATAPDVA